MSKLFLILDVIVTFPVFLIGFISVTVEASWNHGRSRGRKTYDELYEVFMRDK